MYDLSPAITVATAPAYINQFPGKYDYFTNSGSDIPNNPEASAKETSTGIPAATASVGIDSQRFFDERVKSVSSMKVSVAGINEAISDAEWSKLWVAFAEKNSRGNPYMKEFLLKDFALERYYRTGYELSAEGKERSSTKLAGTTASIPTTPAVSSPSAERTSSMVAQQTVVDKAIVPPIHATAKSASSTTTARTADNGAPALAKVVIQATTEVAVPVKTPPASLLVTGLTPQDSLVKSLEPTQLVAGSTAATTLVPSTLVPSTLLATQISSAVGMGTRPLGFPGTSLYMNLQLRLRSLFRVIDSVLAMGFALVSPPWIYVWLAAYLLNESNRT